MWASAAQKQGLILSAQCCCCLKAIILAFALTGGVDAERAQVQQQLLLPMDLVLRPTGLALVRQLVRLDESLQPERPGELCQVWLHGILQLDSVW